MAGLKKPLLRISKTIQSFFYTLIPEALRSVILIICITYKYCKRVSYSSKYMSVIDEGSSIFICRGKLNPDRSRCTICLSEIGDGEEGRELNCKHIFHRNCVDQWLRCDGGATCPICRRAMVSEEIVADYKRMLGERENYHFEKELGLILLSVVNRRSCNGF
ncbi:hypothetical protein CDL12_23647 [Handroanthus impetiginosus]|uniref:RING-type domain-containing protein n=1 Tax=Handroanthus impetiginosus TaxID=429701 RepID=A0A2G9GFP9_9LAMI|nr:hypothetical protein CDL12_23647 [Handroanthus impetiginosus]